MLRDNWDRKICEEYKAKGCQGCPLKLHRMGEDACRATYHWDKGREEWTHDDGCEHKDYCEVM